METPEQHRARTAEWRKRNPEKVKAQKIRERAREREYVNDYAPKPVEETLDGDGFVNALRQCGPLEQWLNDCPDVPAFMQTMCIEAWNQMERTRAYHDCCVMYAAMIRSQDFGDFVPKWIFTKALTIIAKYPKLYSSTNHPS